MEEPVVISDKSIHSEEESVESQAEGSFNPDLVNYLLKLLHRALNIEDPQQDQLLQDLLFAEPVKKPKVFPLSSAIKGLIKGVE